MTFLNLLYDGLSRAKCNDTLRCILCTDDDCFAQVHISRKFALANEVLYEHTKSEYGRIVSKMVVLDTQACVYNAQKLVIVRPLHEIKHKHGPDIGIQLAIDALCSVYTQNPKGAYELITFLAAWWNGPAYRYSLDASVVDPMHDRLHALLKVQARGPVANDSNYTLLQE